MNESITWVGIDAHKKFLEVAILVGDSDEFEQFRVANTSKNVKKLARTLVKKAPGEVRCCYEAGPCGYGLQREMETAAPSLVCTVIAPSLIPVKPGVRIKTDRRDARKLANYLRCGMLTAVAPPTTSEEAVRDLCRCREDVVHDVMSARHRLLKFLLRRAIRFTTGRAHWTQLHLAWLRRLEFSNPVDQIVFDEYLQRVDTLQDRKAALTKRLEEVAATEPYLEPVGWLRCFHGMNTVAAMTIVAELHDFTRFHTAPKLMCYLGVTPSEHSSGGDAKRGSITKAGNGHVRRMLIQAAQQYRHKPHVGAPLRRRREGQPNHVIAIANKAHQRLHRKYRRLMERGKHRNVAVTAVARELIGFIWDVLAPFTAAAEQAK